MKLIIFEILFQKNDEKNAQESNQELTKVV